MPNLLLEASILPGSQVRLCLCSVSLSCLAHATSESVGELMFTPISAVSHWEVNTTQISVNGQTVSILNQTLPQIADSGTSNILLPTNVTEVCSYLPLPILIDPKVCKDTNLTMPRRRRSMPSSPPRSNPSLPSQVPTASPAPFYPPSPTPPSPTPSYPPTASRPSTSPSPPPSSALVPSLRTRTRARH